MRDREPSANILIPGEIRRVSAVYHYKKSNVCGIKVNGKEVVKADLVVLSALNCISSPSRCQAGGKYYKASKAKEIMAVLSAQGFPYLLAVACQVPVHSHCTRA